VFGGNVNHIFRLLFVCTGNICRSPAAEGIARHYIEHGGLAGRVEVDSAGTYGGHAGEPPDPRMIKAAARRGYDLTGLRARELEVADFKHFDLLLALDRGHLEEMEAICPIGYGRRIKLLLDFVPGAETDEVPDPYFGGPQSFEYALDLCEAGVDALLKEIAQKL
jgi:protein-tyrosine phosphatase